MAELEGPIQKSFSKVSKPYRLFRIESILEQFPEIDHDKVILYSSQAQNKWGFTSNDHRTSKLSNETLKISEQQLTENLSQFSRTLLSSNQLESKKTTEALKDFLYCYKNVMEEFFYLLYKILQSRLRFLELVKSTISKFQILSLTTSQVNLASSTLDIGLCVGSSLRNVVQFPWNPKIIFYVSTLVGGLSICGSLFALSYAKHTIKEISRNIWEGKNYLVDLDLVHRKGNWIDKDVQNLFPHGINLNLIDQRLLEKSRSFDNMQTWKQYICSAIILSNIQKDVTLHKDERFLATVKQFVESEAAQLWWNRLKIRRQIDVMFHESKTDYTDDLDSASEVFINRAAVSVLPAIVPLAGQPSNFEKMRLILSSLATVSSVLDLGKESEEFQDMNKLAKDLRKEYNNFNKIYRTIDTDYD